MTPLAARRALSFVLLWTVLLLWLGSVVHATGSSLACPDWPTCFGTMFPPMEGGIFWEHSHRLVAGALILIWILASVVLLLAFPGHTLFRRAAIGGFVLLLVQAAFGGLTVVLLLPDWISTTHLVLAYLFLALVSVLVVAARAGDLRAAGADGAEPGRLAVAGAGVAAVLALAQSIAGALVRHTDAGMACGRELLTCRGGLVPGSMEGATLLHFGHRALGILLGLWVVGLAVVLLRRRVGAGLRGLHLAAAGVVVAQIALGYLSVHDYLGVIPVSLHTVGAALVFSLEVAAWTRATLSRGSPPGPAAAAVKPWEG